MKLSDIKANEKLPRGTYFYIKVGHRFYAGETIEQVEVVTDPTEHRPLTYVTKDGKRTPEFQAYLRRQYWGTTRSWGPRGTRRERDISKGTLPKYAQPRKREEKIVRKDFTGRHHPKLVDDESQAKQFRSKNSVEKACETLRSLYGETGAKISVLYKGASE